MQNTVPCPLWALKNIIHDDYDNDEQDQALQSVSRAISKKLSARGRGRLLPFCRWMSVSPCTRSQGSDLRSVGL